MDYIKVKYIKNALKNTREPLPIQIIEQDLDDFNLCTELVVRAKEKDSRLILYIPAHVNSNHNPIDTDYLQDFISSMYNNTEIKVLNDDNNLDPQIYLTDIEVTEIKEKEVFLLADYNT